MRTRIFLFLFLISSIAHAQQQTFDIFTFTPPQKWSKVPTKNTLGFNTTDKVKRTWAQIEFVKSTASKGSIEADFENEWNDLVMKRFSITTQPIAVDTQTFEGWKLNTGLGKFIFNKDSATVLLHTFSDGINCSSFLILSNTTTYGSVLEDFLSSLNVSLPGSAATLAPTNPVKEINAVAVNDGFKYNTTNFDDGWTSVVKEDWVEATKGNIKALLHYPREEDKKYYPQYKEHVQVFWNLLVAPRYRNLRQYQSPDHLLSWQPGLFAAGLLTDNATGKDVWVALFSKGKTGWVEVICPDKKTFVDNFGVDQPELYFDDWDRMLKLFGLNKFAVGENDLVGNWSDNFYGATSYYSTVTGMYAGSTTFSSSVKFTFNKNKTYKWELGMASTGLNSTINADHAKASGTWKMLNDWQVWCSEIERSQKTYNAYFSCIKGGRVLWLQDTSYGSYTAYGKIK